MFRVLSTWKDVELNNLFPTFNNNNNLIIELLHVDKTYLQQCLVINDCAHAFEI